MALLRLWAAPVHTDRDSEPHQDRPTSLLKHTRSRTGQVSLASDAHQTNNIRRLSLTSRNAEAKSLNWGNLRKRAKGELKANQQEISARSDGVGPSSQSRETCLDGTEPRWPKHKIFLSHSGLQKAFTEHLCKELERVNHFPFFDRRSDSLRKGERFYPPLITAAQECRVAVLVLSEEFFTASKWPMMELNEFVKAQELDKCVKILPLFFQISMTELGEKERQARWLEKWKTMASKDGSIDVNEWEYALTQIPGNNGISCTGKTEGEAAFVEKVVEAVCQLLPPDVKWDVSHVQCTEQLSEPILRKLAEVEPSPYYSKVHDEKWQKVRVVGLYGMGGGGKTTISRAICNQMVRDFGGKVCYIEFGSSNSVQLQKTALQELTDASPAILSNEHDKLADLLKQRMDRQKVFLGLDNVWDNQIQEAQMYLNAGYHEGSNVLVTSRSLDILNKLKIQESDCMEMPDLEREGAIELFLHYAGRSWASIKDAEWKIVKRCVKECYFLKKQEVDSSYEINPTHHESSFGTKGIGKSIREY